MDRDARENGMLIVDDLDAAYDLTFADPDYEKADFLSRVYGIVRVNGLRSVLEAYLNNADAPSSPLRTDREGFNRDHEFAQALLDFISNHLRPVYEKERQIAQEKERSKLSSETRKRIDEALKHLNKYFHRITELTGPGTGGASDPIPEPASPVIFFPQHTKLVAGQTRAFLLLIREDVIAKRAEVIATASEGISVQPETEIVDKRNTARWTPHREFFAVRFSVTCSILGQKGTVIAAVERKDGDLIEATLRVEDVLAEPVVDPPEALEFRPPSSTGRPGRRNNLVLLANSATIPAGHYVRFEITKRTGDILLFGPENNRTERFDVKLDPQHQIKGQSLFRVLVPWSGTSWNQHARVVATVKVGGEKLSAEGTIRLDEPQDGGFFKDVKYAEIDPKAPSQFAAGVITVNINDSLNRHIFGRSKEEFDERISSQVEAQQRLAALLLEEASFRALQQRFIDGKVLFPERREIAAVHEEIDEYKFESALDVYRALSRSRS